MAKTEKFIQSAIEKPGSLRAHYGVSADEKIPVKKAKEDQARLHKKALKLKERGEKLPEKDAKLLKRLNLFLKVLRPAAKEKMTESLINQVDDLLEELRGAV